MALFGKKYTCSTCGMKFRTEEEMREHNKMHMSGAGTMGTLRCAACGATFRSQSELDAHKRTAHRM